MKIIILPLDDEDLLKKCHVTSFRSTGSGGQHVNTTDSAVRLLHIPTGIVVISQEQRSQYLNKRRCITKLRDKVTKLNYRKPKRVATRIPLAVKNKNIEKKKKDSQKKQRRRPFSVGEHLSY